LLYMDIVALSKSYCGQNTPINPGIRSFILS
jgi:hypothetical protein